jgi:DNA-binding Xre family transcriptional regulator
MDARAAGQQRKSGARAPDPATERNVTPAVPPFRTIEKTWGVFAHRLVRFRELRRMSARSLAKLAGISRTTLDRLESGQAQDVMMSTVERLGRALSVTPDALLGYDDLPLIRVVMTPELVAAAIRDRILPHLCEDCHKTLPGRAMHTLAECMMAMSDLGHSSASIAEAFNMMESSVDSVLDDEHEARRHRKF